MVLTVFRMSILISLSKLEFSVKCKLGSLGFLAWPKLNISVMCCWVWIRFDVQSYGLTCNFERLGILAAKQVSINSLISNLL